tara:strand:- start:444 stop:641 length:198 start_codon:yes stop_codon:yes gene_type:complete
MGNFVNPADYEHMLVRRSGKRRPKSKGSVFGDWNFDKKADLQDRMRNRRLQMKKIRKEREQNADI